jgi:hypothetical protein
VEAERREEAHETVGDPSGGLNERVMLGRGDPDGHVEPAADALDLAGFYEAGECRAREPLGDVSRAERALPLGHLARDALRRHIHISTSVL